MNKEQRVFPHQMEQILNDKGFVLDSKSGFHLYSIPGVPFSYKTHIGLNRLEYPNDKDIFNQMVMSALEYSNKYLKELTTL